VRRSTKAALVVVTVLLGGGLVTGIRLFQPDPVGLVGGQVYLGKSAAAQPLVRARAGAWCGTDAPASDRTPDLATGQQVHVIYAFPSDGADRYASLAPLIAADLSAIDGWWRRQDPTRTIRFDLFAFPGCTPGLDQLDLSRVKLSQPASYYAGVSSRGGRLVGELNQRFAEPTKKYLVYYDGVVDEPRLCGQSTVAPNEGGRYAYSLVYSQACHADVGTGVVTASVVAHELGHNLGAVPPGGPPHACEGDTAHICDDENDLMFPYTRGQGLSAVSLDAGHDDYYAHSGAWWDLQDSAWLAHIGSQFALTVTVGGSGKGTVSSASPGISCPASCSATFDPGTQVELSATPGDHTRFVGWSGGCTADPCVVTMSSAQTVVAKFVAQDFVSVVIQKVAKGAGVVTSRPAGIVCPGHCSATFERGTRVQLVAAATKNSAFNGWTGSCSGKGACVFDAAPGRAVIASFGPAPAFRPPLPKCKPSQHSTKKNPCRK
jgi:Divergent InlB B-repeat domain